MSKPDNNPPDYTPVANASAEAAKLGSELGQAQLAENKRQYDLNSAVAAPVVKAQGDLLQQQIAQGNDYNDYMKQYSRPVETSLFNESMGFSPEEIAQIQAAQGTPGANDLTVKLAADATARKQGTEQTARDGLTALNTTLTDRIGESDKQVYDRNAADIEAQAGQAVADSRAGLTGAINTAARQGLRYGWSPAKMAAVAGGQSVQNGAAQAAAANAKRSEATGIMYTRGVGSAQQGLTGGMAARSMKQQDDALTYAKKLDTAGLYRGLPSASQGAYNTAVQAGNSAVGNQMQPSTAYMSGISAGNGTQMQGQQLNLQGQTALAGLQSSNYNATSNQDNGIFSALGTVGGQFAGSKAGSTLIASAFSDEKVKKDIKKTDENEALDGIKKLNVKNWKYDPEKVEGQDDKEHTGAMAQDMKKNLGDTVSDGKMVDLISAVGVNMAATKALAKQVDKLQRGMK